MGSWLSERAELTVLPGLELAAHLSGGGALTVRLGHLRLAHGGSKWVSKTLGLKGITMRKCHCCALFRAITPSAGSSEVVATRVGQRVSLDWWCYRHAAIPRRRWLLGWRCRWGAGVNGLLRRRVQGGGTQK